MPKLYEALAEAFRAEGVDTQFTLMGDGNMHWSTAFSKLPGVHTCHVRHEHATVAAATAYNIATNKVAVASVTCGPGVTQLMTALPAAVRARLPLVVFAGEAPINAKFYNQDIDQAPLVTATGAHYIAAHSLPRMMDYVREAFHLAKHERQTVVIGVPYDLQKVEHTTNAPYETSAKYAPDGGRVFPDPEAVAKVVDKLAAAKRPILFGGRGVQWAGAREAMIKLADRCGALLANSLPARGLFTTIPTGSASRAATSRRWAGRCSNRPTSFSWSARACPTTSAAGTSTTRPSRSSSTTHRAACATASGPRRCTSGPMRWSASRRSSPGSTRSWAPASRRRLPSAPRSWRIASRPSRRTRCTSTSRPASWIRARWPTSSTT
ncbi:MAG: thiamine pyrophosphate-binding protein [Alphaproteobacteria bacterium]|nr:thiamine pyrophosphate-binding protein [Alphaproteobacteria bacterium]